MGEGTDLVLLAFERRREAAASRRGPKSENVDHRPTAAVPAAARVKTSLTRRLSQVSLGRLVLQQRSAWSFLTSDQTFFLVPIGRHKGILPKRDAIDFPINEGSQFN